MVTSETYIEDTIRAIFAKDNIVPVASIRPLSGGVENQSYAVNERLVIRLHNDNPRYATEARVYKMLADDYLPVPRVLALDMSKAKVPYQYIVTTMLHGSAAHPAWNDLNIIQRKKLASQIGATLAYIHTHTYDTCWTSDKKYSSWAALWQERFTNFCIKMHAHRDILGNVMDRLQRVVEAHMHLFMSVRHTVLLHGDYQLTNLLQHQGKLTGVLDMEWAHGGDPAWDFATDYHWRKYCEGSVRGIYDAYRAYDGQGRIGMDAKRRIAIYRLLPMIEDAVYANRIRWMDGKGWHWSMTQVDMHLRQLGG